MIIYRVIVVLLALLNFGYYQNYNSLFYSGDNIIVIKNCRTYPQHTNEGVPIRLRNRTVSATKGMMGVVTQVHNPLEINVIFLGAEQIITKMSSNCVKLLETNLIKELNNE